MTIRDPYHSATMLDRTKLMACSNERSRLRLKQAIGRLEGLWDGASLDIVSVDEIPRRLRAMACIPDEPFDANDILELIKVDNTDICTYDLW